MYSYLTTYSLTGAVTTSVAGITEIQSAKDISSASTTQEYESDGATGTTTYSGGESANFYNVYQLDYDKLFTREVDEGYTWTAAGLKNEINAFGTGATRNRDFASIELISTSPYAPFSTFKLTHFNEFYTSGQTLSSGDIEIPVYRYGISEGSMFIHHYGSTYSKVSEFGMYTDYTTGADDNYEPYYSDTNEQQTGNIACEEIYPQFWRFTTNYTMPISTLSSQNISITVTTESNSNFYFIDSQTSLSLRAYSYTFITTNTSLTNVEYTTTQVSNSASYTTLIGTSVGSNNSLFSIITEENSDGFAISPIAGIVFRPDSTTFYASNLSASYEGLYTNHIITYSRKPQSNVTFNKSFDTATRSITELVTTGTITNIYTYTYLEESSSQRTLTYNYDGSIGSWETTSTNYTSLGTSEVYYYLTSYSVLTNTEVYTIPTTSTVEQYASSTLFQSVGSVLDENAVIDYSINLKTVNTASTSIVTSSASLNVAFYVSYTATTTGYIGSVLGTGGITQIEYFNEDTQYTRKIDQNFFAKLSLLGGEFNDNIPISTLYGAKYDNQENRIGLGNIYHTPATTNTNFEVYDGFSEIPAIFAFKNRFTYNATSVIPNNGMLSNIKSKADMLNDFPANGAGRIYTESSTDSTSSTTYTYTEKLNVRVNQIPTGYGFTLPEGSTVETSNTSRYTFRYGDGGTAVRYTRYNSSSSTTYFLEVSFGFRGSTDNMRLQYRPSYFDQYNTNSSFPEAIVVPVVKSIKEMEDVLMVSGTQITNDPASLSNRDLITASNAFSYTFIDETGGTTNSTSTFSRGSYTFSKNAVLRTIDVFTPHPNANSVFPTGWAIPTHPYPSFLSFTNYFGSTYIDV